MNYQDILYEIEEPIFGTGKLAFAGLEAFAGSAEAEEGHLSFVEKRPADFSRFR